jgi:hypothetical protein
LPTVPILERRVYDKPVIWDRRKFDVSKVVKPATVLGIVTILAALPITKAIVILVFLLALVLLT